MNASSLRCGIRLDASVVLSSFPDGKRLLRKVENDVRVGAVSHRTQKFNRFAADRDRPKEELIAERRAAQCDDVEQFATNRVTPCIRR